MKKFILHFLIALFLPLSGSAQGILNGTIRDKETGAGLAGVAIYFHETGKGTYSGETGEYTIAGLRAGNYHLHVNLIGYASETRTIRVDSGNNIADFLLNPTSVELKQIVVQSEFLKREKEKQSLSIETVDQDFLLKNSGSTLSETLDKLPGINSFNTGAGISKPVIRGMTSNRVIVNENGIKQQGQQWGLDHGLEMDQFGLGTIEIVKGPVSYLYGSDGIGGVINIRPPSAPKAHTSGFELQPVYRSNNNLYGLSVSGYSRGENIWMRTRASFQDYADYKIPADSFRYLGFNLPLHDRKLKNSAGQIRSISLSGGTAKDWGKITITGNNYNQKAGFFSGAVGIPGYYSLIQDESIRDIDYPYQLVNHSKVIVNSELNIAGSWLETDIGYQRNNRSEISEPHAHSFGAVTENSTLAHHWVLQTYSLQSRYTLHLKDSLDLIMGINGETLYNKRDGYEFLIPDYHSSSFGIFSFTNYDLSAKISLTAGIRGDLGLLSSQAYTYMIPGNTGFSYSIPAIKRNFWNWSGGLGIAWVHSDFLNLKFNLGKSFRIPTIPELTMNGIHHGTSRHEQGDQSLSPEKGYQADLSISYERKNYFIRFTPFYNYFRNYIFLKPTVEFSPLPDGGQLYKYSQTEAIYSGFEAQAEYHPLTRLHLEASVDYVYTLNLNSGLGLPFIPPLSFLTGADYTLAKETGILSELFGGIEFNYHAAQFRTERNEKPTPGWCVLNLSAGTDVLVGKNSWKFSFRVNNVFNTAYLKHISRYRILNIPEPGRNFIVNLIIPINFS